MLFLARTTAESVGNQNGWALISRRIQRNLDVMPTEIDSHTGDCGVHHTQPESLVELLGNNYRVIAHKPAIVQVFKGQTVSWSWGEVIRAALELAARFESLGLCRGDLLVHVGKHSADFVVVDIACLLSGIVHVALHSSDTVLRLGDQVRWLSPQGFLVSGLGTPLEPFVNRCAQKSVILDMRPEARNRPTFGGLRRCVHSIGNLVSGTLLSKDSVALAEHNLHRATNACDPDAPSTVILSSGTSGEARGIVHSQRSLLRNAQACDAVFLENDNDLRLSWLPMSHAFGRIGDLYTAMIRGGCLGIVPDRREVLDAAKIVKPTVILGVPVFFDRLAQACCSGKIPSLAQSLGGCVRVCVSGGASLKRGTQEVFMSRGVPLVEGYGLTEAGPVVALSSPRVWRAGKVGKAVTGVELTLTPDGELLVRTPSRALAIIEPPVGFSSSTNPAELFPPLPTTVTDNHTTAIDQAIVSNKTQKSDQGVRLLADGWLATGDTATIDSDGFVEITGRLSDMITLSSGVKIAPSVVEACLSEDPLVAQVCVLGQGLSHPIAIIVPEPSEVRKAIREMGLVVTSRKAVLKHPRVLQWLARRIRRVQHSLSPSWRVSHAVLESRAFSPQRLEVTESMKLRRTVIAKKCESFLIAAASNRAVPRMVAVERRWRARVPASVNHAHGAVAAIWHGDLNRAEFSHAGECVLDPPRNGIQSITQAARIVIEQMRSIGTLYDETGKLSCDAETLIGQTGLWGLSVKESYSGCGASWSELISIITHMASVEPTVAGMLSVHCSIGAVSAIEEFGSQQQKVRWLPELARGEPLSIFAATEPQAGCDLGQVASSLVPHEDHWLLSGKKIFITGARAGRLVKVLVRHCEKAAVVLVRLPSSDTKQCRLFEYGLHPLRRTHNRGIEFHDFLVEQNDLLVAPGGDGMKIVWHGLDRGRITLAAQAAGTLRMVLASAVEFSKRRCTWGAPIASRQLVQGRFGRIAAAIVACDSLATWAARCIDSVGSAELEAITAKITASDALRMAANEAMKVHGGRSFLQGHPLGDSLHDLFAAGIYEGESDLLGLAFMKVLARSHPLASIAPRLSKGRRLAAWLRWRCERATASMTDRSENTIVDKRLRAHARLARRQLGFLAVKFDRQLRLYGRKLAEKQMESLSLSEEIRAWLSVLATSHVADAITEPSVADAADCFCRDAAARAMGKRLTSGDLVAFAALGEMVVNGHFTPLLQTRCVSSQTHFDDVCHSTDHTIV